MSAVRSSVQFGEYSAFPCGTLVPRTSHTTSNPFSLDTLQNGQVLDPAECIPLTLSDGILGGLSGTLDEK